MGLCASRENQGVQENQARPAAKYGAERAKPAPLAKGQRAAPTPLERSCTIGGTGGLGVSVAPTRECSTSLAAGGEPCVSCGRLK